MSLFDDLIPNKGGTSSTSKTPSTPTPEAPKYGIYSDLVKTPSETATKEKPGVLQSVKDFFSSSTKPDTPVPTPAPKDQVSAGRFTDLIPPAKQTEPAKPSFLDKAGSFLGKTLNTVSKGITSVTEAPANAQTTRDFFTSEFFRHLPLGIGAMLTQIQDDPETASQITFGSALKEVPGAGLETTKSIIKAPVRGATELPSFLSGGYAQPKISFNIPGLGEVNNSDFRIAERVASGEDVLSTVLEEKSTGLFDALFFADIVSRPFLARPTKIAEFKGNANDVRGTTGLRSGGPEVLPKGTEAPVPIDYGPKSFRIYKPPEVTRPLTPQAVALMEQQGISLGDRYNPDLPTFFRVTGGKGGVITGEVVQVRPSYFDILKNKIFSKAEQVSAFRQSVAQGQGVDPNLAITEGKVPRETFYKGKGNVLSDSYATTRIRDIAGKLDDYQEGLGEQFRRAVDPTNATLEGLVAKAEEILNRALPAKSQPNPQVIQSIIAGELLAGKTPPSDVEVLHSRDVDLKKAEEASKKPSIELQAPPAPEGQKPVVTPRGTVLPPAPKSTIYDDLVPTQKKEKKEKVAPDLEPLAVEIRKYGTLEEFAKTFKKSTWGDYDTIEVDLPIDKLTSAEPSTAFKTVTEAGRKITEPVEVIINTDPRAIEENGRFVLVDGNHRLRQAELNGDKTIRARVGISNEYIDEFGEQVSDKKNLVDLNELYTKVVGKNGATAKPPKNSLAEAGIAEDIASKEASLKAIYRSAGQDPSVPEFTRADAELSQMLHEMEVAEAGRRVPEMDRQGYQVGMKGISSTFQDWIPEHLRSRELFNKVMGSLQSLETLKYPVGNRPKQRALYDAILSTLDTQLGVDTSHLRNDIIQAHDRLTEQRKATKAGSGSARGGKVSRGGNAGAGERAGGTGGVERFEKGDQIVLRSKSSPRVVNGSFVSYKDDGIVIREAISDLPMTASFEKFTIEKAPTQKERVAEAVAGGPKSIKEVAEETQILEPNVRRILGVGAKDGTFERLDKGVYVLKQEGKEIAWIEAGDAKDVLARMAQEGKKFDMVFLDPAYFSRALIGGNRGIKAYDFILPPEFKKVMESVSKLVRTPDTHVYLMLSGARTAQEDMLKYAIAAEQAGFKVIGEGGYQKLFKDGSPVTNVRGEIAQPERIILYTQRGEAKEGDIPVNLNFRFIRPAIKTSYATEKPAELLKALIEQSTLRGESVLDPFAGSGVTGAEALKAGRRPTLIEKKPEVVEEVIKPRLETQIDDTASKEFGGAIDNPAKLKTALQKTLGRYEGDSFAQDLLQNLINNLDGIGPAQFLEKLDGVMQATEGNRFAKEGLQAIDSRVRKLYTRAIQSPLKPKQQERMITNALKASEEHQKSLGGASSDREFDLGVFRDGTPVRAGGIDKIQPVEFPELVDIARELSGSAPKVRVSLGKALGYHKAGEIFLRADMFKPENIQSLAKLLAHEIGHLVDYLPDRTMKRGNILGRLLTLRNFLSHNFNKEEGGAVDTKALREQALKETLSNAGKKWGDYMTDPALREKLKPEVKARYQELLNGLADIKLPVVKQELVRVTEYWRPYVKMEEVVNADTGKVEMVPVEVPKELLSPSYIAYRMSSKELYADAISMLFNSPGLLEEMAPTFYEKFFEYLDQKPQVREAYFELQGLLGGTREDLIKHRREGVRAMFESGDYKAIELQNEKMKEREKRNNNLLFKAKFELVDKNAALIDRVDQLEKKGVFINPDDNPVYYLEERNYLGGKIKAIMETSFNPIYQDLQKAGINWHDFGEALFYQRIIAGDRSAQANPRGITVEAATELHDALVRSLTPEQAPVLASAVVRFRDQLKAIAEEAFKEGLYTPELYQQMQENPAYVTFQVIDHLEEGMSSKVYKSIGTLKDITNPADASILKMIATVRAIEVNKVKRVVVDFQKEYYPNEIEDAKKVFNGKNGTRFIDSRQPYNDTIIFYRNGKAEGYYVDSYIKKSIDNESIGQTLAIVSGLRFLNSHLYRPLFIGFNLGFQSFNFIRDFKRFYKNIPDMTILRAIQRYHQAYPLARARAFGPKTDSEGNTLASYEKAVADLTKLENDRVFSVTFNDILQGENEEETQIQRILRTSGIDSFQDPAVKHKFLKPFVHVLEFIKRLGDLIETMPKAAGYYELSSRAPLTKADTSYIRKNIGSPDFLAGGHLKPATNEIFLFSNAITQGIRSDFNVATNPKTRSAYWWKTMKLDILPKLLMMAGGLGLFGATLKKIMEDASEYDKTNYTVIPLGIDSTGKSVYFRFPSDEGGRLVGGLFWKVINASNNEQPLTTDLGNILSFTGGQVPSISPTITVIGATAEYLAGQNPYDAFRGRNVLSEDVFKAGGWRANKAFLGWLFNQVGGGIFYRFTSEQAVPKDQGTAEKVFNLPVINNVVGRFFRVTDYGEQERLNQIKANVQSEEASRRLDEIDAVNVMVKEAQQDPNIGVNRRKFEKQLVEGYLGKAPTTGEEVDTAKRLVDRFRTSLQKGGGGAEMNALISATSNDQKIAILKDIKTRLTPEEYIAFRKNAITNRITTAEVFHKAEK